MRLTIALLAGRGWVTLCALASFVVVGRNLAPAEFGLFALASAASLLPHQLVAAGLYEYVLGRDPDGRRTASAATAGLLTGVAAAASIMAMAAVAAWVLAAGTVSALLAGLALAALLWSIVAVQEAVLIRDGRGWTVALVLAGSETAGLAAMILSFQMGAGIYALVIARIVAMAVMVCGYAMACQCRFRFGWSRRDFAEMSRYASGVGGSKVLDWTYTHGSDLLVGALLPVGAVGHFRMGIRMHQAAYSATAQAFSTTLLAHLGRHGGRTPAATLRCALRGLRLQLALTMPVFAMLAVLSGDVVRIALGPAWHDSAKVLATLCLATPLMICAAATGSLLLASGRSRTLLGYQAVMCFPMFLLLVLGAAWGVAGIAAGKAAYLLVYMVGGVAIVSEFGPGGGRIFLRTAFRLMAAGMAMAASVFGTYTLTQGVIPPGGMVPAALLSGASGLGVFLLALRLLDPEALGMLRASLRLASAALKKIRARPGALRAGARRCASAG